MGMLAEIFQKPKPILGKVQLLALPGAPGWDGHWESLISRAEQEATALATGGVDGLIIENYYDMPYTQDRIDTAGAIAMALLAKRIKQLTQLPVGLSILQNDPETALAVAINIEAPFMRLPLIAGAMISESGVVTSKLNALLHYKNRLRIDKLPFLMVDISQDHLIPAESQVEKMSPESHLKKVAETFARHPATGTLIVADGAVSPQLLQSLRQDLNTPVMVENRQAKNPVDELYNIADGLILDAGIYKSTSQHPALRPTVDMSKVEELVNRLRKIPSVTEMDPDVFLTR
jgi:hypothetical protein